jgi:hypothetical protein
MNAEHSIQSIIGATERRQGLGAVSDVKANGCVWRAVVSGKGHASRNSARWPGRRTVSSGLRM